MHKAAIGFRVLRPFTFLLLCSQALACADATPTRTLIRFSTAAELEAPEGALLRVVGYANGLRQHEAGESLGMFPFEEGIALPVEAENDDGTRRFTLFAELLSATGTRISWARIRSGFVQDERREVRIEFQAGCQAPSDREQQALNYDPDTACGSHDTCASGPSSVECRSACFAPEPIDSEDSLPSTPIACPVEDDIVVERLEHGWSYTCALAHGEALCWSQLGVGESPLFRQASRVMTPDGRTSFTPDSDEVVDIAASANLACMVLVNGGLRCGGDDSGGALTLPAPTDSAHCCEVEPSGFPASARVEVSDAYICALTETGELHCSGHVPPHDVTDEPVSPARRYDRGTTSPSGWTALFGGPTILAGLGSDRLELLTSPDGFDFSGVDLLSTAVAQVAVSVDGLCVVDTDGGLRCWGDHEPQDLGSGWQQISMAG
ncbi:MAG: hypothetical protein ACI9KE_006771, partial [Polyangiales bacterium]